MNPEKQLQSDMTKVAALMKCQQCNFMDIFIPDIIRKNPAMRNNLVKTMVFWAIKVLRQSQARPPFDAVLVTPTGSYNIEFKANTGKQEPHQKATEQRLNGINPHAYYVVRGWMSKKRNSPLTQKIYDIKQNGKVLYRTDYLPDVIEWFKQINNS